MDFMGYCKCGRVSISPKSENTHTCEKFWGVKFKEKRRKQKPFSGDSTYRQEHGEFQAKWGR